jgi:hypothetical protein
MIALYFIKQNNYSEVIVKEWLQDQLQLVLKYLIKLDFRFYENYSMLSDNGRLWLDRNNVKFFIINNLKNFI